MLGDQCQYLSNRGPTSPPLKPSINPNLLSVDFYWDRGGVGAQCSDTDKDLA